MKALKSLSGPLRNQLFTQALNRWQTFSPREQRGLHVLSVLLGVLLFWSIALNPALNTLRDSDIRRAQIDQQQAHMLALQARAQALEQTVKSRTMLSRDEALRNLQSLNSGAQPGTQIQLNVQGDRVAVQLKAVPAPNLANWLSQARTQAQALPVEAHITRSSNNAATTFATDSNVVLWDGTLVLSLPNRGATTQYVKTQ